jgi:hypothetical protein
MPNRVAELGLTDADEPVTGQQMSSSFNPGGGSSTAVLSGPAVAVARARPASATLAAPTTGQKIDAIYGVRQLTDGVVFAARFDGAGRVLIAGDFNNWSAMSTPMAPAPGLPGLWQAKLPLISGRYRYRFVVDGHWTTDPHNATVEANQFGELNNVVEVA